MFTPLFRKSFPITLMPLAGISALFVGAGLDAGPALACTTAVVSGRVTADGRPLLWKNRDTSTRRNEVVLFEDGKFRFVAVVNAGSRETVWMGVNSAGLCVENSLSRDLSDGKGKGMGNGSFMKLALATCSNVDDFRGLLKKTDATGRSTTANFGVIDAVGGAAIFEAGPTTHVMFDANDPVQAPKGYVVRSNFSTTGQSLSANPAPSELAEIYSAGRFLQACSLIETAPDGRCDLKYILRNLSRDLSSAPGQPYPASVNGRPGQLPDVIATDRTISRTTTVSAAVFHGVRKGESPRFTTMWVILGDPKFSIAVPCWTSVEEIADDLTEPTGGEIGEIASTLRDWSLTADRSSVRTEFLPSIWIDLWALEDAFIGEVASARGGWLKKGFSRRQATLLHHSLASRAMQAMQEELVEMKQAAIRLPAPDPPVFAPLPSR